MSPSGRPQNLPTYKQAMISYLILSFLISLSLICTSTLAFDISTSTSTSSPKYLTHLTHTSNSLITPLVSSNITSLSTLLLQTPCVLFYSYSFWTGRSQKLIYTTQTLQRLSFLYKPHIEAGCVDIAVAEINTPFEKEEEVWRFIDHGAYWDSLAVIAAGRKQDPVFLGVKEWEGIVENMDGCLREEGCGLEMRDDGREEMSRDEL